MSDYYEKDVEGAFGICCPRCHVVKTPDKFKRKLTRAQSRARGYAGHVLLTVDSKWCVPCQPKPKTPQQMRKKELLNKVASGDINRLTAELELARRHREARLVQRRAANALWVKKRAAPWRFMIGKVGKEIEAVRYQQAYYKKRGTPEIMAFLSTYRTALDKLRAYLRAQAIKSSLKHSTPPETNWWPAMLDKDEREAVNVTWQRIPTSTRILMRQPLFLRWANPPEVDPMLAEDRLYQASQAIESAAKRLNAQRTPRLTEQPQPKEEADNEPINWDDL